MIDFDDNFSNLLALPDEFNGFVRLLKRPRRVNDILECHFGSRDGSHQLILVVLRAGVDTPDSSEQPLSQNFEGRDWGHLPDIQSPVNNCGNKVLQVLRLGAAEVTDLADSTTTASTLHTPDKRATTTILNDEVDTNTARQP